MSYRIELNGVALHHYGNGVYGWGPVSSTDGKVGALVEWFLRTEAEDWMQARRVFCTGARVVCR